MLRQSLLWKACIKSHVAYLQNYLSDFLGESGYGGTRSRDYFKMDFLGYEKADCGGSKEVPYGLCKSAVRSSVWICMDTIRQKIARHTNNRPETRRHILYNLRWAIKALIKTLYRFAVNRQLSCLTPLVLFARKFANNWLLHLTTKKSLHACSVYQSHCTECHRQKI